MDPSSRGAMGPLGSAARRGDLEMVRLLLDASADPNAAHAVWNACMGDHSEVVVTVLGAGADPDLRKLGKTPLLWAASSGNDECVTVLLDSCDIHAVNDGSFSTGEAGWNAVTYADAGGHAELADALVERGVDDSLRAVHGVTDVHRAAKARDRRKVEELLADGADVNALDAGGGTALHEAAYGWESDHEIIRLLLDAGASVDLRGPGSIPAIDFTMLQEGNDVEAFRLLAEAGASMDLRYMGPEGETTLGHMAAYRGDGEFVRIFVAHGGDVSGRDSAGRTPLHLAAATGNADAAAALIEAGADLGAVDDEGNLPSDLVPDWLMADDATLLRAIVVMPD